MKFFMKKYLFQALLIIAASCLPILIYSKAESTNNQNLLQITEADVEMFESMGMTKADLEEAAAFINNMSPKEQKALIKEGQEIQKKIEKLSEEGKLEGLTNEDDFMKLLLEAENGEDTDKKPTVTKEAKPLIEKPAKIEEPAVPVKNLAIKTDPALMLTQISEHLGSLQQKASSKSSMAHRLSRFKLELDELILLIHLINKKELIAHLTNKDFSKLYQTLEKLHSALLNHEPKIAGEDAFDAYDIDNPYEILGLSYTATGQEIKNTFGQLKQKYSPEAVLKTFEAQHMSEKDLNRKRKEAFLFFDTIKSAYSSLKDHKEKAQIDRALKERREAQQKAKATSKNAFNKLFTSLSTTFYDQKIIQDIQALLQKYAPEEKAKADAWEKDKKEALELNKKREAAEASRAKIASSQSQQGLKAASKQKDSHQEFWSKYRLPEPRPVPPMPKQTVQEPSKQGNKGLAASSKGAEAKKPTPPGGKKPDAKPGDKKEDKKENPKDTAKKSGAATAGSSGGSKDTAKPNLVDPADIEVLSLLHGNDLEKIQKDLKEPASKEGSAKQLLGKKLPLYLNSPKPAEVRRRPILSDDDASTEEVFAQAESSEPQPEQPQQKSERELIQKIDVFISQNNIDKIANDFASFGAKLADPKLAKEKKEAYKNYWQSVHDKHKDTIENLWSLFDNSLNPQQSPLFTKSIHASQQEFHGLNLGKDKESLLKRFKDQDKSKTLKPGDKGYLGFVKYKVDSLHKTFNDISKKLGVVSSPKSGSQRPPLPPRRV